MHNTSVRPVLFVDGSRRGTVSALYREAFGFLLVGEKNEALNKVRLTMAESVCRGAERFPF